MKHHYYYFRCILPILLLLAVANVMAAAPTVKIIDIWVYGDVVTDSLELDYKQNNLRIYCGTEEEVPFQQLDYQFMLEGYDNDWFTPFPDGWYFYTDLPPGDYVFRAKCRMKGSNTWGAEVIHPFSINCPWWQTWWAKVAYTLLAAAIVIYILYLLRERIRLYNRLRVEEETKRFRDDFILQACRDFRTPLSIIRSIAEKQKLNMAYPLSKTDIQHLRNSSRQMMDMVENLIEFRPNDLDTVYSSADDVIEMRDVPLNSHKVLVVVRDENMADIIERDLLRMFNVVRCTAEETLGVVDNEQPEAVVIDTSIKGANPFELPKQIKEKRQAVVVLISDFLTAKDLIRAVRSEADDFVRKPFNCQYLTALIVKRLKESDKNLALTTQADSPGKLEATEGSVNDMRGTIRAAQGSRTTGIIERRSDKILLDRLETAVSRHLSSSDFDVNALAAEMQISRAQLNITLKRLVGTTPSEYIRNRRLATAASLIENTTLTIQEIMFRVGMTDTNNFYRRFKEKYGTPPNAYRK